MADRLISLSALVGSIGLVVEVAVILVDVVGRYFGSPLKGAQDISQMAMVIVVFGGMALCDKLGGHIAVDLFEKSFPDWLNRLSDFLSAMIGALIFGGIAWTIYTSSKLSLMLNLATNVIYLPKAYFQWAICVFAAITAFAMILRAISLATAKHHVHVEEHSL
ncbi:MAG: TRAP transporter small permease [Oricola sp.]